MLSPPCLVHILRRSLLVQESHNTESESGLDSFKYFFPQNLLRKIAADKRSGHLQISGLLPDFDMISSECPLLILQDIGIDVCTGLILYYTVNLHCG